MRTYSIVPPVVGTGEDKLSASLQALVKRRSMLHRRRFSQMWSKRRTSVGLSALVILGLLMASCAPTPKPAPTSVPTPTPPPTYTPYPTYTLVLMPTPTLTSKPTPAPEKVGRTMTEQEKAEDTDIWASYLEGETIQAIAIDKGCLWLGTDEGLVRFSKEGDQIFITHYTEADGLPCEDIQALKVYEGELWIGTNGGGLSKFDGEKFTNYGKDEGLFDPRVMALDVNEDYVWLGLTKGLSRFHKRTETFQNWELPGGFGPEVGSGSSEGAGDDPRRIYADSILIDGKHVWHAAFNVIRSNWNLTESKEFTCSFGLPHSRVTSIYKIGDYVYVGTIKGLARLREEMVYGEHAEVLSARPVSAMAFDGRYLWVGTNTGIGRLDTKSLLFSYFNLPQGQETNLIISLDVDEDYVWIGTLNGLLRLSKRAEPPEDPFLENFEGGKVINQNLIFEKVSKGIKSKGYIDPTTGANGTKSSLCVEIEVLENRKPDVFWANVPDLWFQIAEKDLTRYEGITFFVKVESSWKEKFKADGLALAFREREPIEFYQLDGGRWKFPDSTEWTRVVIPFSACQFRPEHGTDNGVLDLPKVKEFGMWIPLHEWHAGDSNKIWIDEIRFYKKGEFTPTVPGGKTQVNVVPLPPSPTPTPTSRPIPTLKPKEEPEPTPVIVRKRVSNPKDPVLEDFEGGALANPELLRERVESGIRYKVYIDPTTGADGTSSSLCVRVEVLETRKPSILHANIPHLEFSLTEKDLTDYEGITFFVKVESPWKEKWKADGLALGFWEEEPTELFKLEGYDWHFPDTTEWTRVTIPFSAFVIDAEKHEVQNRVFELYRMGKFDMWMPIHEWHAGESNRLWIDEIRFYKKGEFEPTVQGRGTPISTEKR